MDQPSDLALIFAAGSHADALQDTAVAVTRLLGTKTVLGVSVSGVIGGGEEIEAGPALSVWLGRTGEVRPLRMETIGTGRTILGFPEHIAPGSIVLLLVDPFSFPVELLLDALAEDAPGVQVVGGLASAARSPGGNTLLLGDSVHSDGAIGVVLAPGTATPLVSQGCRPIGQPWVVTDGSGQMINALGGEPALQRLDAMIAGLSIEDRALAVQGLHIGIVVNEQTERFERGDFLIRGLLGGDRSSGAIAVGDRIEVGQVIQFHVRDAASASDDLHHQLGSTKRDPVQAALIFTCNGRGSNLFPTPSHDAWSVHEMFPGVASAGMFCAGELGPVGGRNSLHGFTATMLLF
jgi:small ligand-binding sensory domain FIST